MKYFLDTEFIDTETCSALISLALVNERDEHRYFEFDHPAAEVTPWLQQNVILLLDHLNYVPFRTAASEILDFVGGSKWDPPEFWAYSASYDWYWLCRVMGGVINLPEFWPRRPREFADLQQGVPDLYGPAHHALNDARSLRAAYKKLREQWWVPSRTDYL